jgi:N-acetylmuramate 1-kinase
VGVGARPPAGPPTPAEVVERAGAAWRQLAPAEKIEALEPLTGQASLRRYARLRAGGISVIAMVLPALELAEEIGGGGGPEPFLDVRAYLEEGGVRVPALLGRDDDRGVLFVEDLGPWTLLDTCLASELPDELRRQGFEDLKTAYERAVDLLVQLKATTAESRDRPGPWRERSFDRAMLEGEWEHFVEHLLCDYAGLPALAEDERVVEAGRFLVDAILDMPQGFTHRDFQSSNMVVTAQGLGLLDFQDALMGPDVYDLVALTRDSYVVLPDQVLEDMIARYCAGLKREGLLRGFEAGLRRRHDLVTVHRKCKDAGRFVFIDRVKGNPAFLRHIPASLGYVRSALGRLPELSALREALGPILESEPGS